MRCSTRVRLISPQRQQPPHYTPPSTPNYLRCAVCMRKHHRDALVYMWVLALTREEEDEDVLGRVKLRRCEEDAEVSLHEGRRCQQARGQEVVVEHHAEPGREGGREGSHPCQLPRRWQTHHGREQIKLISRASYLTLRAHGGVVVYLPPFVDQEDWTPRHTKQGQR